MTRLFPRDIHAEATLLIREALDGKDRDNHSTLAQLAENMEHCMTAHDVPLQQVLCWIHVPRQKLTLAEFRGWCERYTELRQKVRADVKAYF